MRETSPILTEKSMVSRARVTHTLTESSSCSVFQPQPQDLRPPESICTTGRAAPKHAELAGS